MSRAAMKLGAYLIAAVAFTLAAAAGTDPHLDPSIMEDGCASCHAGHGQSDSPMMDASQKDVCLRCHGEQDSVARRVTRAAGLAKKIPRGTFSHPIDADAFSRFDGVVTCTSCHSPHRGMSQANDARRTASIRKSSPRDPSEPEYVLCTSCHGAEAEGAFTNPGSVADRIDASNVSYHPVEAPTGERSSSVRSDLSGREISCTDCHGSNLPGAKGPHVSNVRHLLASDYSATDGEAESASTYSLCYSCHDRKTILGNTTFPEHERHVVELKASCSTCHDPHGSPVNRALIRFDEYDQSGRLLPSTRDGRLAFESPGPGSGACYVNCHGRDHGPEAYGSMELLVKTGAGDTNLFPSTPTTRRRPTRVRPSGGPPTSGRPGRVDNPNP